MKRTLGLGWLAVALWTAACGDDGGTSGGESDASAEVTSDVDERTSTSSSHTEATIGDTATANDESTSALSESTSASETQASGATSTDAGFADTSRETGEVQDSGLSGDASVTVGLDDSALTDASLADAGARNTDSDSGAADADSGDASAWATVGDVNQATCAYYARCAPTLFTYYGGDDCLATLNADALPFSAGRKGSETPVPGLPVACASALGSIPCAPISGRATDQYDEIQYSSITLAECLPSNEGLGCVDDDQCGIGLRCTAEPGQCGECTRRTPTDPCGSMLDCPVGQQCVQDQCVARKTAGAECDSWMECVDLHCEQGFCLEPAPVGTACEDQNGCDANLWCDDGQCALAGEEQAPCDEAQFYSCQAALRCIAGVCTRVGTENVAIGETCANSASCVAGAECTQSECVETSDECAADNHCAPEEFCDGDCLPKLDESEPCDDGSVCKSGLCAAGACVDAQACR